MVATPSIRAELERRGFDKVMAWGAASTSLASTLSRTLIPIGICRGRSFSPWGGWPRRRISRHFSPLPLPGTKVVIGDGPAAAGLRARFPDAIFLGNRSHADLPAFYAAADVFVFPSRTDTFGLVLIEALACGLPVAAFPAPGPLDIVGGSGAGVIADDLATCGHGGAGSRSVGMPAPRGTLHLVSGNGPVCREPRAGAY